MKKYDNWDQVEETSSFKTLVPSICGVKILSVENVEDKEYLKIEFDIVKSDNKDEFKGYFTDQYERFQKPDNKPWPNQGTLYRSYKESAISFFKSFITAVEKSNAGYRWDWNEKSLVGKFFVAVFGEEEYLDEEENEVKISVKVQEVRSAEAWKNGDIKIPALKKLKNRPETKTTKKEDNDSFYESSKQLASEEDLPF